MKKGRKAVTLTRLDEAKGRNGWEQYDGPVASASSPVSFHTNLEDAINNVMGTLVEPTDVLLVRSWNGIEYDSVTWYTHGV